MPDANLVTIKLKGKDYPLVLNECSKDNPFSTGSTEFTAQGKITISATERYQVNINIILIGSKPKKE